MVPSFAQDRPKKAVSIDTSPMSSVAHVRPAEPSDLDRLVEIHLRAFPDPRGIPERLRNFRENPLGGYDRLFVAEREGIVVGHTFSFDLELGCLGACVPVAGIASVGVAPEARGQGVATALLRHVQEVAREQGKVASVLFPFREAFYARLDYGKTTPALHLECASTSLAQLRGSCKVRAATGEDRGALGTLHDACTLHGLGRLRRTSRVWDKLLSNERSYVLVAERSGAVVGYAIVAFEQEEAHARVTLRVQDLAARDADAERSLLAALGAQRDHAHSVWLEVPYGSHLPQTILDIDARRSGTASWEHRLGHVTSGAMVRALSLDALCAARPLHRDGTLSVYIPQTDVTYSVTQTAGERKVTQATGRVATALATTWAGASSLLLGGISAGALVAAGLAEGDTLAVAGAQDLLGTTPFFGCDAF